jgi:Tol biopolymer transport system component
VSCPCFAHQSDLLVLHADLTDTSGRSIWILDPADPANPVCITAPGEGGGQPCWTADDTRIVFVAGNRSKPNIYSMKVDGSDRSLLGSKRQVQTFPACRP